MGHRAVRVRVELFHDSLRLCECTYGCIIYLLLLFFLDERDFIQIFWSIFLCIFVWFILLIHYTHHHYHIIIKQHQKTHCFYYTFHHQKHKKTQTTWFYQFYSNSFCNLFEFFPLNSLVKLTTHIFSFNQWFPYTFLYFPSKTCVFYSKMHRTLSSPILSYPLLSSPILGVKTSSVGWRRVGKTLVF